MTTAKRTLIGALVLIAALVLKGCPSSVGVASAKGPPDKVTITGPGIKGELEITDLNTLNAFAIYQFNDLERRIEKPHVSSAGYKITRWTQAQRRGKMTLIPWDYLTYYPDPAGGPGYLFYDGLDPSIGSTEGQGEWFLASEDGGAAMKRIIENPGAYAPPPKPWGGMIMLHMNIPV